MLCTFALLSPGEMNALHVLGESTAGASGFGRAGACRVVRVVVTQAAPVYYREQEAEATTATMLRGKRNRPLHSEPRLIEKKLKPNGACSWLEKLLISD